MRTGQANYQKLLAFVGSLPTSAREADLDLNGRDRNLRDVVCHLHEWHNMVHRWYGEGREGGTPAVPGEGHTWRTLPALNREIWRRYQDTDLDTALTLLDTSHHSLVGLAGGLADEQLFGKGVFAWTKTSTLGAYFVSATASHYDWALKTLKPLSRLQ